MQKLKKLIAPILFTLLLVLCLTGMLVLCLTEVVSPAFKIIGIVFCAAFIGASVFVLLERIKEVRSGEEDDLSKY